MLRREPSQVLFAGGRPAGFRDLFIEIEEQVLLKGEVIEDRHPRHVSLFHLRMLKVSFAAY